MIFCTHCSKQAPWLSMRSLCAKCQKIPGAVDRRAYNWRTGKIYVKKDTAKR